MLSTNIGQRAILACTPAGNVLWELALIDDATIDLLKGLGGIAAIAISYPHYTPRWWSGAARSGESQSTYTRLIVSG